MQNKAAAKLRDFYNIKPDAPIYQKEFGFYVLDRWIEQGYLKSREQTDDYQAYLRAVFGFDEPADNTLTGCGWTVPAYFPYFEEKVLEDRGAYEVIQDRAGRKVLTFKGKRTGFMPEYLEHPVKDRKSWEENVKWRLDPESPQRLAQSEMELAQAKAGQKSGNIIVQRAIGGYMFLRSLMGPEQLLYLFYDDPQLIHSCMETWLIFHDKIIEKHQSEISLDELFLGEDICYNNGPLISPDMIREFLFPYYQQLLQNIKKRNNGKRLNFQLDTDGNCNSVIELYRSIGCNYISPCEVASFCDVVSIGKKYPDLLISGGIDKRVLAQGKEAIKTHVGSIMPTMKKRGGYIPTCDHGVPAEVPFENYMYYRGLMLEYGE